LQQWRETYFDTVDRYSLLQTEATYHIKGVNAPVITRGIFATLSPRSVPNALVQLMSDNIRLVHQNDTMAKIELAKQESRFFAALHAHRSKGHHFVTIDIDTNGLVDSILNEVSPLPVWMVTKTSRGNHIILDLSRPEDADAYYKPGPGSSPSVDKRIMARYKNVVHFQRDSQEPIPGCLYFADNDLTPRYVEIVQ
jgi:hypothetical protein